MSAHLTWDTPNSIFCYGEAFASGSQGLWRVNAIDGSTETLIFAESCPPCSPVTAPHQDMYGNLYYFYSEVYDVNNVIHPSLSLMRSASDGITGRVAVRPEIFNVASALWTPDGNAVLIVQTDISNDYPKSLILVPLNPSLPVVTIMADTSGLARPYIFHWGP